MVEQTQESGRSQTRWTPRSTCEGASRRASEIDNVILADFVLGLSSNKVGAVLLGRAVSAISVSRVVRFLEAAVVAFHASGRSPPVIELSRARGIYTLEGKDRLSPGVVFSKTPATLKQNVIKLTGHRKEAIGKCSRTD